MKKIAFYTLGCKVNQSDTASMEKLFRDAGFQIVDFEEPADICLINTCSRSCSFSRSSSSRVAVRAIRKAARPTSMLAMGLFMVPHPFLPRIQVLLLYQDSLVRESRDW